MTNGNTMSFNAVLTVLPLGLSLIHKSSGQIVKMPSWLDCFTKCCCRDLSGFCSKNGLSVLAGQHFPPALYILLFFSSTEL